MHKHCAVTLETIKRSQILLRAQPLRAITIHAQARLKRCIRHINIKIPILWNRTTGHLVDGYSRLFLLDELSHVPEYLIIVAVVELDPIAETELSLLLNNVSAQGQWNIPALEAAIHTLDADLTHTGFDEVEVMALCDSEELTGLFAAKKDQAVTTVEQLQAIKDARAAARQKNQGKDNSEFYAVLVFKDDLQLDQFMDQCQLNKSERYHDGKKVSSLIPYPH